uniref:Uncharacterized protein n=1 Tax=Steinernema glaseri TaxID=37863 RepID=A0A1I7ZQ02_9BILA
MRPGTPRILELASLYLFVKNKGLFVQQIRLDVPIDHLQGDRAMSVIPVIRWTLDAPKNTVGRGRPPSAESKYIAASLSPFFDSQGCPLCKEPQGYSRANGPRGSSDIKTAFQIAPLDSSERPKSSSAPEALVVRGGDRSAPRRSADLV